MTLQELKQTRPLARLFGGKKFIEPLADASNKLQESKSKADNPNTIYLDAKNIWITNDGLLRDEGVLFGLSGASTEEKLLAIKNFYADLKASADAKRLAASSSLENLLEERKQLDTKSRFLENLTNLKNEAEVLRPDTQFLRNLLGLIFISAAAVGNFYLIHYFISPRFGIAASIGIFLFGLFSLIAPLSSWLDPEEQKTNTFFGKLKIALLEIGSPLATTILVSYIVFEETLKIGFTIAFGLFLLFVFFFCGKLLLGVFHKIVKDFGLITTNLKAARQVRKQKADIEKDAKDTQENLLQTLQNIEKLQTEVLELQAQCTSYDQQCELKINLFLSEYNLAKNYYANPNI
ncbi:hypothetical protein EXU57_08195 [Segetibacter sp. 3557_3]|uniref:hypothetical protein n=1 Tax=Segetibacter sp. 3557_3 TaxID=2547429 RepID=UPI0010589FDE|nr:hypothetical protein [Segetibacter sp. 3557_3]TDH26782.1 hypothetical protein EXU57_08195 [Segetibacter sp. 3557_3]